MCSYPVTSVLQVVPIVVIESSLAAKFAEFSDSTMLEVMYDLMRLSNPSISAMWYSNCFSVYAFTAPKNGSSVPPQAAFKNVLSTAIIGLYVFYPFIEASKAITTNNKLLSSAVIKSTIDPGLFFSTMCKKLETASFSLPQVAIGFFTNIAASPLRTFDSNLDPDSTPLVQVPEVQSESKMSNAKEVMEGNDLCSESELVTELGIFGNRHVNKEDKQIQEKKYLTHGTENDNLDKFSQFDMVADCSDHHFLDTGAGFWEAIVVDFEIDLRNRGLGLGFVN
uniref:Uncharacterized protein n=1 Tax=Cannabis sativa TaxID=3483 RepID=A0A803Q357_CANSA